MNAFKLNEFAKFILPTGQVVEVGFQEVTPDLAKDYLARRGPNREIKEATVLQYTVALDADKFGPPTHQGIAFDEETALIDGQHRCEAIVRAGKSLVLMVSRGWPSKDVMGNLDGARMRNLRDKLVISGVEVSGPMLTPYIDRLNACIGLVATPSGRHHAKVRVTTVEDYEAWKEVFGEAIEWSLKIFKRPEVNRSLQSATVGGALAFAYPTDPARVDEFAKKLATGVGLEAGDPALALRRYLVEVPNNKSRKTLQTAGEVPETRRKILRTLQLYLEGTKVFRVHDSKTEGLPYFRKKYQTEDGKRLLPAIDALVQPWLKRYDQREAEIRAVKLASLKKGRANFEANTKARQAVRAGVAADAADGKD